MISFRSDLSSFGFSPAFLVLCNQIIWGFFTVKIISWNIKINLFYLNFVFHLIFLLASSSKNFVWSLNFFYLFFKRFIERTISKLNLFYHPFLSQGCIFSPVRYFSFFSGDNADIFAAFLLSTYLKSNLTSFVMISFYILSEWLI